MQNAYQWVQKLQRLSMPDLALKFSYLLGPSARFTAEDP